MGTGKVMSMAEFDVAYNAYRDRLTREGTIRTLLDWTAAQEAHLRFRFASDFNLKLDTSVREEIFGDDEKETRDLHDSIYPLSFFDEAFAFISNSAADPIPLEDTYCNDLLTAPEKGATFIRPPSANIDSKTLAPLAQKDYNFPGHGPFKGNPNVFMGSGIEVNGYVTNKFAEVADALPHPGTAGYIPDHCIDPRLLKKPQASVEVSAGFASTSEATAAAASRRSPLISSPPVSANTPANSIAPSAVASSVGTANPSLASTPASSTPPAFVSTMSHCATRIAGTSGGSGSIPERPSPAQRPSAKKQRHPPKEQRTSIKEQTSTHKKQKPVAKMGRCSKPVYPIEGVTRQLRQYFGLNVLK